MQMLSRSQHEKFQSLKVKTVMNLQLNSCSAALIFAHLFLPNKNNIFGAGCAYVPDCWPPQSFLNIPSCKQTFS